MKENTKKRLVIAGLALICALAVFGISRVLYKEPVQTLENEDTEKEELELVAEPEDATKQETEEKEDTEALVIEPEKDHGVESGEQNIQPEPVKTEKEKPSEPPALSEDADVTNPDTEPTYEEEIKPEEVTPPVSDTPKTGDTKDGMVYVEGFGWLTDEGAGSGTNADDMYENGNKVGIMD